MTSKHIRKEDTLSGVVFACMQTGDAIREQTLYEDEFFLNDTYLYKRIDKGICCFKCLGNGYATYEQTFIPEKHFVVGSVAGKKPAETNKHWSQRNDS